MKLNATARAAIKAAGFTVAQWARMWGYSGEWGGDQCGCFDDRCANGFHHYGTDDCGCLQTMLDDAVAWRQAASYPNSVTLAPPYGLFRYVAVSTPGVLATVSATAGGFRPDSEAESVVRVEPREGWSAAVTTDDSGRIIIRIVKTQEAAPAQYPDTALMAGKAAHDTWCADDDWDELDAEARALWVGAVLAGHAVITGQEPAASFLAAAQLAGVRVVLEAFDWDNGDRQYVLEAIDAIVRGDGS